MKEIREYNGFKVGDTVKLLKPGTCYSSYEAWAKRHNIDGWQKHTDSYAYQGKVGKIIKIAPHGSDSDNRMLSAVDFDGHILIVGLYNNSLELIDRAKESTADIDAVKDKLEDIMKWIRPNDDWGNV